jgi:hypothetical protein
MVQGIFNEDGDLVADVDGMDEIVYQRFQTIYNPKNIETKT